MHTTMFVFFTTLAIWALNCFENKQRETVPAELEIITEIRSLILPYCKQNRTCSLNQLTKMCLQGLLRLVKRSDYHACLRLWTEGVRKFRRDPVLLPYYAALILARLA